MGDALSGANGPDGHGVGGGPGGVPVFTKHRVDAPPGFFACEAAGLRWLGAAEARGGARVVRVVEERADGLDLEMLRGAAPSAQAAEELGRGLAATHAAGAPAFGSPAEGWTGDGFFGPLQQPTPLRSGSWDTWGAFHAEARIAPLRDQLAGRGLLSDGLATSLDRLADRLRSGDLDDDNPPARVHGDLWAGNVMWTARGAVLVDPAVHGGHPGADLAMLGLFGLPYLDRVLAAYREAAGWSHRWARHAGLHQVFPVGMHAVLFGRGWLGTLEDLVNPLV